MTSTAATVCRSVVDELCPDGVYHAAGEALHLPPLSPDLQSPNIPQADGHEEIGEHECCQYAKQRNSYYSTLTSHTTSPLNVISVTRGICGRDHSIILCCLIY